MFSPTSSTKKRRKACCMRWMCCGRASRVISCSTDCIRSSPASCSLLLGFCSTSHTDPMASDANTRTLHSFLDYLRVDTGSAKLTIAAYTSDLAQFAEVLEKRKQNLTGARREDVRAYIQELFSNSLDGRSVGRKLSAIRQLYRHLLLDGKIDKNPTLNIAWQRKC